MIMPKNGLFVLMNRLERYYVNKEVGGSGHEKITNDYLVAGWVFEMIT